MTDKELLELAAKAVGYVGTVEVHPSGYTEMGLSNYFDPHGSNVWAPLHNDGQALRLAVALNIDVWLNTGSCSGVLGSKNGPRIFEETYMTNPLAATRRAIVRAAAEIGKAMP